ncbi:MAG TPA: S9 family peptidase [Myxococcaceae bacterium]|nr:S9 family peptidase [Myxococcaceae bacterium]
MLLPAATIVLLLAQPAPGRADAGSASARVSSIDVAPAPGLPRVLVSGVPAVPADFSAWLAPYTEVRRANLADPGDDGRSLLVLTRLGGSVDQIHRVAAPLGMREQLTFGKEPVAKALWLPGDPRYVFFLQDTGGAEFFQLYRLDLRTGVRQLLTDGKSRHESFQLSRDGRRLAYAGTGRNGTDTDVYLAEVASPTTAQRLTEESGSWEPMQFSPDGQRLLVQQQRAIDDVDLWVVDLATRKRTRVTPDAATAGKASVREAAFSGDGKSLYLVTDRGAEFNQLFRVDLAHPDASWTPLTADLRWNVERLAVAPDGTVAFATNEDGYSKLYVLKSGGARRAVPLPPGVLGSMSFPTRTSDVLTFSIDTPTSPRDVWQVTLKTGKLVRWTRSEVGGMDATRFVAPELVRYPSTGGIEVPAFLFRPRALRPGSRAPVVVYWHGGPESQERPIFWPYAQAMVDLGMAVLLPNVRGSDGYGKAYLAADDGVKREEALKDIGATLDWIARQPELDPGRVAALGGSYGGYMTLASAAFYPERFRAAVDVVGISRFSSFLANTSPYRRELRRVEYGDERNADVRAVLERISPLNSADKIQAAMFVLQGKNDPRVPQSEAEQIVRALREKNRPVWYLLALDEGHGFKKKETVDYGWAAMLFFLREQLVGGGSGPAGAR